MICFSKCEAWLLSNESNLQIMKEIFNSQKHPEAFLIASLHQVPHQTDKSTSRLPLCLFSVSLSHERVSSIMISLDKILFLPDMFLSWSKPEDLI